MKDLDGSEGLTDSESSLSRMLVEGIVRDRELVGRGSRCVGDLHGLFANSRATIVMIIDEVRRDLCGVPYDVCEPITSVEEVVPRC